MAPAPDRLVCMGTLPTTGVDDAIKEMEHCAKLGIKGVKLDRYPQRQKLSRRLKTTSSGRRRSIWVLPSPTTIPAPWDRGKASPIIFTRKDPGHDGIRKTLLNSSPASQTMP